VSSLREGHANLLCIVPILTDVTEVTTVMKEAYIDPACHVVPICEYKAGISYPLMSSVSAELRRASARMPPPTDKRRVRKCWWTYRQSLPATLPVRNCQHDALCLLSSDLDRPRCR